MKNFIKIAIFSLMVFLLASCACNRTTDTPPQSEPLAFELQEDVTITSTDSTEVTLTQGSIVYVYEDDCISEDSESNFFKYTLLLNRDMLDDKEDYGDVMNRMGMVSNTQVVGFMDFRKLAKQKRL